MAQTRNILLFPVSLIYGLITGIRNFLYNTEILNSESFTVPVICIGNITVGGTGKTPHTEYIADLLRHSLKVAVLSRGYKRSTNGFIIASPSSKAGDIGDEPLQIARKYPDVIVAVDSDRVNGIKAILEKAPETGVVLLDDGFQHRRVRPGLSILLTDYNRPFFEDYLLPYGNLREWRSNSFRADIIVITKCPRNLSRFEKRLIAKQVDKAPFQKLFFTSISYKAPLPLFRTSTETSATFDLGKCSEYGVLLVTGIANPAPFREYMQKFFNEITEINFPDHHNFSAKDIETISARFKTLKATSKFIMTTEKDAIRLLEHEIDPGFRKLIYYVPVGIFFTDGDSGDFDKLIADYAGKNKRNN
jgi:tetraacyldisaccharide 4'-kinase